MKLRIAFKEAVIKLVQDGFCQLCVFSIGCHIILISHLKYHFVKRLFLITFADFFVVIFDTAIFTFLLGVILSLCFIKQLMLRILNGRVAVFSVQMGACRVNIFCDIGAAVVCNYTVTGHSTDCSFYSCYLQNYSNLSKLVFAARRRVLLLLPKVTQKHF